MPLYLDSFDLDAWDRLMPTGLFKGITTNPLLAKRAGHSYAAISWPDMFARAANLGAQELHVQVPDCNPDQIDFAREIKWLGDSYQVTAVCKIPLTEPGVRLARSVIGAEIPVLMTACYHAKQMYVAQSLGAQFIAPYYGRMDEAKIDARAHLAHMRAIGQGHAEPCEILVASLRSVDQMLELSADGHATFTISPQIAEQLLSDDLTLAAVDEFESAARE